MKTFLLARVSAGLVLGAAMMVLPTLAPAATVNVVTSGLSFSPSDITINVGDTIHWSVGFSHDVTSDTGQAESFSSGPGPTSLDHTFTQVGRFTYFCTPHAFLGMVGSVTVQGAPPNQPPVVSITSPANGAVLPANSAVTITANASDPDPGGGVAGVEFFDGGVSLGIDQSFPWEFTVNSLSAGPHTFTAVAVDNVGAQSTPASVTVTGNTPPSVSITSPVGGSTLATNFPVTIKANASDIDPGGSVTSVQFFDGGTSLGTVNAAPFEVTVTLSAGPHTLTARATDNLNTQTTSAGVGVTVVSPAQLRITSTERRSPNLVLAFASTPGLKYVVETNTVLSAASWKPLVTNVATAASTSVTNLIGPAKVFYRVALVP